MNYSKLHTVQVDERDCGVAALSTVLKYFGSRYSLATLRKFTKTTNDGTTALGIVNTAEKLGIHSVGVESNLHYIKDKVPFIAQLKVEESYFHYVVVFEINNDTVILSDPAIEDNITKISLQKFEKLWTNIAILFNKTERYTPYIEKKQGRVNYVNLVKDNKWAIIQMICISCIVAGIEIIGAYYFQWLINKFIPDKNINRILEISVILIGTYFIQQILLFLQGFLVTKLYRNTLSDIVEPFFKHVIYLPLMSLKNRSVGDFTSRINDSYEIASLFTNLSMNLFINIIVVVVIEITMITQNLKLAQITIGVLVIYLIVFVMFIKPFNKFKRLTAEKKAIFESNFIESVKGIETLKILGIEKEIVHRLEMNFEEFIDNSAKFSRLEFIQQAMKIFINLTSNVCLLSIGAFLIMDHSLSIGQLVTFNILFGYFSSSFLQVLELQSKFQSVKVAINRLNEVFLLNEEDKEKSYRISDDREINGNLKITDLNYSYGYTEPLLSDISMKISAGEKIALIGMSGSGKTTLGRIISGLYPIETGNISSNGVSISDVGINEWRREVLYLPQETILFKGTIKENILYGRKNCNVPFNEIVNACKIAGIDNDIAKMPEGFETYITEDGGFLSGGQKQRIALARAILSKPKILILDESTSALDTITERKVINNLHSLKDMTIIFISHHLSITKKVDKIFLLKDGKIVNSGTHDYLMRKSNYYQTINERQ